MKKIRKFINDLDLISGTLIILASFFIFVFIMKNLAMDIKPSIDRKEIGIMNINQICIESPEISECIDIDGKNYKIETYSFTSDLSQPRVLILNRK